MIKIPDGLHVSDRYLPPDLGRLYWVDTALLSSDDKKPLRPVVVIAIPDETYSEEISVVRRSTSDRRGPMHEAHPEAGLGKPGWFCEQRWVNRELWTPANVRSIDLVLGEDDLAWVMQEYLDL